MIAKIQKYIKETTKYALRSYPVIFPYQESNFLTARRQRSKSFVSTGF